MLEKTTSLEGTIELIQNPAEKPTVYLIQEDGTKIEIMLPEGAVTQLQLKDQQQCQIEGIFLGTPTQDKIQEKLFARLLVRDRERILIDTPKQLTTQELAQLKTYQDEQLQIQKQLQQSSKKIDSGDATGNGTAKETSNGSKGGK
ncbi:hypothetical protein [uncultured Sphaerochaeta sp.]|uniref:hypothetical protein n=1 Tax=uncultured Sphaerochaeta sp. TaxID=886478 RepID=UPI002A0A7C07|nr:hypothetical protein [uncultured Sphaerochaeta sp.]